MEICLAHPRLKSCHGCLCALCIHFLGLAKVCEACQEAKDVVHASSGYLRQVMVENHCLEWT
eukprot:9993223-Prorocentrum_lima.AAC.1